MRTALEIQNRLLTALNFALPRLGMYGGPSCGDISMSHLLSDLAFIDERENEYQQHFNNLKTRGTFTQTGVSGAFYKQTGLRATSDEVGSIYASIAFKMGYLSTARILSETDFITLTHDLRETCSNNDFTTTTVIKEFGIPSWKSSDTNPFYPCVYLYLCDKLEHGVVAFDFWNVVEYDREAQKTIGQFGSLPVLRNIRIEGPIFANEFTFTPVGTEIRSQHASLQ